MMVKACDVPDTAKSVLQSADFADAFAAEYHGQMSAFEIAQNAVGSTPSWVDALMILRTKLVAPFGLVTEPSRQIVGRHFVGFFPVISVSDNRVVLGLDDKHLDFRLVVETTPILNGGTRGILTTIIKCHNIWGKIYLAVVLPFHKIIVPSMMRNGGFNPRS